MENVLYLLKKLSPDELLALHKLLGTKKNDIDEIIDKFGKALLPANGYLQTPLTYMQILQKIAKHNNVQLAAEKGEVANEQQLFLEMFQMEYHKMSEAERADFLKDLELKGLSKTQVASVTALGTIGIAQASGFGIYLLATSTVGAITSALGISLSFAFYTGMSSVISVVIGPLGFLVLGYALYRSFKDVRSLNDVMDILTHSYTGIKNLFTGSYEKATLCFKYIAAMRVMLKQRMEDELSDHNAKFDALLKESKLLQIKLSDKSGEIYKSNLEIAKHEAIIKEHRQNVEKYVREKAAIEERLGKATNVILELEQSIINKETELTDYNNKFQ